MNQLLKSTLVVALAISLLSLSSCYLLITGAAAGIDAAKNNKKRKAGSLENHVVTDLKFDIDESVSVTPGRSFNVNILATFEEGTTVSTEFNDSVYTSWKEYDVTVTNGVFSHGVVQLNADRGTATSVKITATNKFHPDMVIEKELPYNYKGDLVLNFSGRIGARGNGIGVRSGTADDDPDDGRDGTEEMVLRFMSMLI